MGFVVDSLPSAYTKSPIPIERYKPLCALWVCSRTLLVVTWHSSPFYPLIFSSSGGTRTRAAMSNLILLRIALVTKTECSDTTVVKWNGFHVVILLKYALDQSVPFCEKYGLSQEVIRSTNNLMRRYFREKSCGNDR